MAELNESFPNGLRSRSRDSDYDDERPRTVVARGEYEALLEQEENIQANNPNTYRNRIVSVVAVALVMTGGAFLVASSRGSVISSSVTNLAKAAAAHQQDTLPMKGEVGRIGARKVAVVGDLKEAPKEDNKDIEPREEVNGAKAKKTSKPTVKPTTPPKPTVPPTTKKPSEKKIQREEAPKDKAPLATRSLGELGNPTPKANPATTSGQAAERVDGPKGVAATVPVEKKGDMKEAPKEDNKDIEPREEVDGAKAKKTSKPTVKPTTPPKPTVPPTTKKPSEKKEVETEKVEGPKLHPNRVLAEVASPTKSPSSGLHKPTWKPSSKPNEHRTLAAVPVPSKDDADPCHDGLSPRCTPPTSKPVEHRNLAGSPTKSPSSGLHKPTWKPSSKPNEHRALKQDFLQTTAILKSPEESLSTENLEATKVHAANAQALAAQGGKDEGISTKKVGTNFTANHLCLLPYHS